MSKFLPQHGSAHVLKPVDGETVDVTGSVATLTAGKITARTRLVTIEFEAGPIRITIDGVTTPTSSVGMPRYDGAAPLELNPEEATRLKMIRTGATNGKVHATYYEYQ